MDNIKEFKYKYETHLHTKESSACGKNSAIEMMVAAKENGYTGTFITNHAWGGNTSIDRSLEWGEWVTEFSKCYYEAKNWGDVNDFTVMFGYESGFNGTEFLIYGLTPEWMIAHPELHDATIEEQYDIVHKGGGIVVHAHPFREEFYIPEVRLFPEHIDAVEAVNATHSSHLSTSHNDPEFDVMAIEYARKLNKPMSAGSDVHTTLFLGGGIMTKEKLNNVKDYIDLLLSDEMYLLTNGDTIYDRFGNVVAKNQD